VFGPRLAEFNDMTRRSLPRGRTLVDPPRGDECVLAEDRKLAALLSRVGPLAPASEIAELRIRKRLEQERDQQGHSRSASMWIKAIIGVAASLFLLETAAAAAISAWPALRGRFLLTVAAHLPHSDKQGYHSEIGAPTQSLPQELAAEARAEAPVTMPAVSLASDRVPSPKPPRRVAPPRPQESSAPPSSAPAEIALYLRALSQLNVEHDPAAALGTLSAYGYKYPNGILRGESTIAQIKAELVLGLDAEVLGLLDAMNDQAFAGAPQPTELRLLRAELLVQRRRCIDALQALEPYFDRSVPSDQRGRALFLRGSCRIEIKEFDRGREDLRSYLREFPQGSFAPRAMETLNSFP